MTSEHTPWRTLIALGGHYGIQPSAFWRLSLREWRALTAPAQNNLLTRDNFEALAAQFPDEI